MENEILRLFFINFSSFQAMEKIREWLLLKISLFKKPLTNYQIPQNALLKNRFFYEFLLANERQLAREVSICLTKYFIIHLQVKSKHCSVFAFFTFYNLDNTKSA